LTSWQVGNAAHPALGANAGGGWRAWRGGEGGGGDGQLSAGRESSSSSGQSQRSWRQTLQSCRSWTTFESISTKTFATSLVAAQGSSEASDAEPRAEPRAPGFHPHSSLEERRHLNSDRQPNATAAAPLLRCRCCSPPTHGAAAAVHLLIHRRRHQLASIAMRRKYPRGSGSHARRATLPCLCSAWRCCATLCAAARRSVQGSRG